VYEMIWRWACALEPCNDLGLVADGLRRKMQWTFCVVCGQGAYLAVVLHADFGLAGPFA
jgi:hypothetical protein